MKNLIIIFLVLLSNYSFGQIVQKDKIGVESVNKYTSTGLPIGVYFSCDYGDTEAYILFRTKQGFKFKIKVPYLSEDKEIDISNISGMAIGGRVVDASGTSMLFTDADGNLFDDGLITYDYANGIFSQVDRDGIFYIYTSSRDKTTALGDYSNHQGIQVDLNTGVINSSCNDFQVNGISFQQYKSVVISFTGNGTDSVFTSGADYTAYKISNAQSQNNLTSVKWSLITGNAVRIQCTNVPTVGQHLVFSVLLTNP